MNKHGGFGQAMGYLFIFVVGSLIVTFLISPNSFQSFKSNIKSILPSTTTGSVIQNNEKEDSLVVQCTQSYEDCKYIAENKFGISITLIKKEKFNEIQAANGFVNTWGNPLAAGWDSPPLSPDWSSNSLPIIIFATRQESLYDGQVLPTVFICGNDGKLVNTQTKKFLCG